ncbi:MAG: helix-turn-helix domain-containing protein [Phyllobacterium sp.]
MAKSIPIYDLYGEKSAERPEFWLHSETIESRSRLHQWEIKSHKHESFFQILHIRSGTGEAMFGDVVHTISPPCMISMPPGNAHGYRFSKDMNGCVITLVALRLPAGFSGRNRLGEWLARPHMTSLRADHPDSAYLTETLDRIEAEASAGHVNRSGLLESYLSTALLLASRIGSADAGNSQVLGRDERRLEMLASLLSQHFREHQPIGFYADRIGVSPTHLNRIARGIAGLTVGQLLTRKIIDEAKRELVFTASSVQQTAFSLGFSDPAYFSRFFTAEVGMTPRAYRLREWEMLAQEQAL